MRLEMRWKCARDTARDNWWGAPYLYWQAVQAADLSESLSANGCFLIMVCDDVIIKDRPYIPTNGENGCGGAQEGCGGYYCCGDPKCNLVRECGGLAGCACPMAGEPEPHPIVPVHGENGCENPQEGCGGHYCCGDTRCNLGQWGYLQQY